MKTSSYSSCVKNHFAAIAQDYNEAAIIPKEVAGRLINRLQWMKIDPQVVLDVGCGCGDSMLQLEKHFPKSTVVGIDLTHSMLIRSEEGQSCICADALSLPLRKQSVDIIFANFLLPWCEASSQLFLEFKRVLKPGGLLLFSTLGPDSLKEIQADLQFIDMHTIGDMLVETGFNETVMDVEHLILHYQNISQVMLDLKNQGFDCLYNNKIHLALSLANLTFEIIYGHAWKPFSVNIPINELVRPS